MGMYVSVNEKCEIVKSEMGHTGLLGVTVKYMGDDLTGFIKEGRHVLTF